MGLYALAAGPGAETAAVLEALAQDDKANPYARAAAARSVVEADPGATVLATLAKSYAKLPRPMCEELALTAARARQTPGAEAFFLCCIKDPRVGQRDMIVSNLLLPPTPTLIAGLKELEADPIMAGYVKQTIERLEQKR